MNEVLHTPGTGVPWSQKQKKGKRPNSAQNENSGKVKEQGQSINKII